LTDSDAANEFANIRPFLRWVGDRDNLLPYCDRADKKNPRGFGECGLLYVLCHKTPNNSIPILYANHSQWVGLFPRNLNQAD
jgi:hypothetical protein